MRPRQNNKNVKYYAEKLKKMPITTNNKNQKDKNKTSKNNKISVGGLELITDKPLNGCFGIMLWLLIIAVVIGTAIFILFY